MRAFNALHPAPLARLRVLAVACCWGVAAGAAMSAPTRMPLGDDSELVDLGPVADSEGKGGRLWVEVAKQGSHGGDTCRPKGLHVLVDVHTPLASETIARQWLQAAHHLWQRACSAAAVRSVGLVPLAVYQGFELVPDAQGNLPPATVKATASLQGKELFYQQYSNNAASLQRQNAEQPDQRKEYGGNAARLQAMMRKFDARRVVDLKTLDKGAVRWHGQVLLVGVRPERVLSRKAATVRAAHREGWDAAEALAEGAEIAKWGTDSRMLAVRVKGRTTDVRTQDRVILQVLGSQVCSDRDCEDYLLLPGGQWAHDKALP